MPSEIMKKATTSLLLTGAVLTAPVLAEESTEKLTEESQNPVADLVSVPLQNYTYLNVGPLKKTQNVLTLEPVFPLTLGSSWNLITFPTISFISQPEFFPGEGRTRGFGDTQFTAFLTPAQPGRLIWGVGPVVQIPTNTNNLESNKWGLGPTAVALQIVGPWVYGARVRNIWSLASSGPDSRYARPYNEFVLQPFINYNFPGGLYLTSTPIMTANWKAEQHKNTWTVPLGGGIGKLWRIDDMLAVDTQVQAFYNVEKPEYGPNWTLFFQLQFLFPNTRLTRPGDSSSHSPKWAMNTKEEVK